MTLASDFRFCTPAYTDDHIWEVTLGGGEPSALSLRTSFGLRARSMRIFPCFTNKGQVVTDPLEFAAPPRLRRFSSNFLQLNYAPFTGIEVISEYWVPSSQTVAGRLTITNHTVEPASLRLELCGQLVPLDGRGLAPSLVQSANVLTGQTGDLVPVIFLTGGPHPGPGPHVSLSIDLNLVSGARRQLTWAQAALKSLPDSFELARKTAARPWDAERAKIEMLNAAQTVDIETGDPDWDAAFAFTQQAAFQVFFGGNDQLPHPSFVQSRQPDQGYSARGDGSDYPYLWSGQLPLESYFLANQLPGAPEIAAGLARNFLAVQADDGFIDCKPGLAGQRGRWLAAPLLASLVAYASRHLEEESLIGDAFPRLQAFYRHWFDDRHDRDADGFPEWDHPLQSGYEDQPTFNLWQPSGQGADITTVEAPALAAMLHRDLCLLASMATTCAPAEKDQIALLCSGLRNRVEECWDPDTASYHYRDRDTHQRPAGKLMVKHRGPGKITAEKSLPHPVRLLVRIEYKGNIPAKPDIKLRGKHGRKAQSEQLKREDFTWGLGMAVATTRKLFSSLVDVHVDGLGKRDLLVVRVMDFSCEDHTLFTPLWAEIPDPDRAQELVNRTLLAPDRFGRPFGIPACSTSCGREAETACQSVYMPWNHLVGEGLLAYGMRKEAAQLTARLMSAVIQSLKKQLAFYRAYHAGTGTGIGERNSVQGLAPLGLFLQTLGVDILSPTRVQLNGLNPFPWMVTVKYRGMRVICHHDRTEVVFKDGQLVSVSDQFPCEVLAE